MNIIILLISIRIVKIKNRLPLFYNSFFMKLFLDTADLTLIRKYLEYGLVDGVTTNPSIIAKEGVDLESRIREIAEIVSGPVSCEVTTLTAHDMVGQGRRFASWAPNIYVKLPIVPEGIKALKILSSE